MYAEQKLDPKLRMVSNGSAIVNTLRAEQAAAVAVQSKHLLSAVPCLREPRDRPVPRKPHAKDRGSIDAISGEVETSVFIELVEGTDRLPDPVKAVATARRRDIVTATVPLSKLPGIIADPAVVGVQIGERIVYSPPLDVRAGDVEPDPERAEVVAEVGSGGAGVLIGIVDVGGFDFSHPDFLDGNGKTRFVRIWDQGGTTRPRPRGFDYGAELTAAHLDAALAASPNVGLPAHLLEPQSQMAVSSHGTHVASIAAGNHGLCPEARIAAVLIDLPKEDLDRRKSFYDSVRIAHAVEYLFDLGDELGLPVSINVSLGTNGHAHDASSAVSRWIDHALATPGRCVSVAAGNAGQEAAAEPGDWGFVMGRIHTSGRLPSAGLTRHLEWIVVGDGIADLSENELSVWYPPQDQLAVEVKPPGSSEWIGPVEPGEYVENRMLSDGTFVSVYNELYAPANGHNTISVFLSPFLSDSGVAGVRAGTWVVRLRGREVRDGRYHAWIERDDPRRLGSLGPQEAWSFPSFFSNGTNVDDSSVSSLACGHRIVSVANLDPAALRVHITSSQGPTRDGREKPEVAAPGTNVVAANGFDPENRWVAMTGTSMASPYVAGAVGLMLAAEPTLTAAQIVGILRRTASPLPGGDYQWKNDAGYGRIAPVEAVAEALRVNERRDLDP